MIKYLKFIVIICGIFSAQFLVYSQTYQPKNNKINKQNQAYQSVSPTTVVSNSVSSKKNPEASKQCKSDDGKEADCFTVSVDASVEQARSSNRQAYAADVGVSVSILTLIVACLAVWWAKESARHARDSVKIAQEIGRAQTRAYAHIISTEIEIRGNGISIRPVIFNSGISPAKSVKLTIKAVLIVRDHQHQQVSSTSLRDEESSIIYVPNGTGPYFKDLDWNISGPAFSSLMKGYQTVGNRIYFTGFVKLQWMDIYGECVELCLRLECDKFDIDNSSGTSKLVGSATHWHG